MINAEKDNQRIIRAMSAMAYDFECFLYTDVEDNNVVGETLTMRESDILTRLIPGWQEELDFFNKVFLLVDYFVVLEERKKVVDLVKKERIFNKLKDNPFTYVYANCSNDVFTKTYFLKFCAVRDQNGVLTGLILGLKDINDHVTKRSEEEKEKEKIKDALKALTDDYEGLFLVDIKNDLIKEIRTTDFYLNYFEAKRDSSTYSKRIVDVLSSSLEKEDYDDTLRQFSLENVIKNLEDKRSFHFNYKMKKKFGRSFVCRAKFSKLSKDNDNDVVLGIRFADTEIIESSQITKTLITKTEEAKKTIDYQLQTLREKNSELATINLQIIDMLASVAELRDKDTGKHIEKVKGYTKILATEVSKRFPEYNLSERDVELISSASVLHDIGKIMVPDSVLLKPGKLTPEEFDVIKLHCQNGVHILDMAPTNWSSEFIHFSKEICLGHHEKWDGRGYPKGLKGDDIPISAQIVSIADCFDALSATRVYKDAYPPTTAFDMIMDGKCGVFSTKLLECFVAVKEKFYAFEKKTHEEIVAIEKKRIRVQTSKSLVINDETLYTIKQLTSDMPLGFCVFKRDNCGTLIYFNEILQKMYGCDTSEELRAHLDNSLVNFVIESERENFKKNLDSTLLYNETLVYDAKGQTVDGQELYLNMVGKKAYSSNDNDVYYMFVTDKTAYYKSREIQLTVSDIAENRKKISRVEDFDEDSNSFQNIRVLVIDPALNDSDRIDSELKPILENEGGTVLQVKDEYTAASLLSRDNRFDAIIINKNNKNINVSDALRSLGYSSGLYGHKIPVILITNEKSETLKAQYDEMGINCVLTTPISASRLSKALISSMKSRSTAMEDKLADTLKRASTDPLTHVKNASAYSDRINYLDLQIRERNNVEFAIVICDINNLKNENDSYGHSVGDIYIKNCCSLICDTFVNSSVYRIGGDEFAVILSDFELKNKDLLMKELEKKVLQARKIEHSRLGKADFAYGIATFDCDIDNDVLSVVKRADMDMYLTKSLIKAGFRDK